MTDSIRRREELERWTAYKSGDQSKFAELYGSLSGEVLGFAMSLCRDPELANEFLQEAWMRLIDSNFDATRPDATIAGWLKRAIRLIMKEHLRKRAKAAGSLDDVTDTFRAIDSLSGQAALETEERLQAFVTVVHDCLHRLTLTQQLLLKTSRFRKLNGLAELMETLLGWDPERIRDMFDAIWPDGSVWAHYLDRRENGLERAANSARDRAIKKFLKCVNNSSAE